MAIDITGFQRMRRDQEEKAQLKGKKEAEAKCPEEFEPTITVGENSYIDIEEANEYFQAASTPKAGGKQTT
jgi:hypothetical protein